MSAKQTVTINGKHYDAHTGLLVSSQPPQQSPVPTPAREKAATHSSSIHAATQKSLTLKRTVAQKTTQVKPQTHRSNDIIRSKKAIQRSPQITRFAAHPVVANAPKIVSSDIIAPKHPALAKAHQAQAVSKKQSPATSPQVAQTIKQQTVSAALDASSPQTHKTKPGLKKRFPRVFSVASASLAVLILGGYLTYLNMPTISIRVAAAGAGINASYPDYRPDGYSLAGPIAYSDGEVSIQFAANAGPQNFTIKEAKSNWDSSAVLENYVKPKIGGEYVEHNKNGLTIYTYDNDAAWVNGGILYTVNGDAMLSTDQIIHIATSL